MKRMHHEVTMRTYYWKQNTNTEIHADYCFYHMNSSPNNKENNFGEILLELLNQDIEPMKRGRQIRNKDGTNMVISNLILRREIKTDGSTPRNDGNVLIGGNEYSFEGVFSRV